MAATDFKWYVYELFDPESGDVFYVGKGSGKRIDAHEIEAASGVDTHKCRKIRSILSNHGKIGKRKVALFCDEKQSYIHEANRIAEYGLSNLTNYVLCTTLVTTKPVAKKSASEKAYELIKMFGEKFASWISSTNAGQCKLKFSESNNFAAVHEMFYNEFCPKIFNSAFSDDEYRGKTIELMRKYKLEIKYVTT